MEDQDFPGLRWTSELTTDLNKDASWHCDCTRVEPRWRTYSNGQKALWLHCQTCGDFKKALPTAMATPDTPWADLAIKELFDKSVKDKRDAIMRRHWRNQIAAARQRRVDYQSYLLTDAWAEKRRKVLKRANGICEGCADKRAVHVHHLSYNHFGRELLFELVALCADCHALCHDE